MPAWNYSVLQDAEQLGTALGGARRRSHPWRDLSSPFAVLILISIIVISFFAGRYSIVNLDDPSVHTVTNMFLYNRTFAETQSARTGQAWSSLFPERGTFFTNPGKGDARRATLSVYHQLHCLNWIRLGYWEAYEAALQGKKLDGNDTTTMSSRAHIRHCIDFIRQSLMCNADMTIELKDEQAGGVHGFGVEHQCRDWQELGSMVKGRQVNDQ